MIHNGRILFNVAQVDDKGLEIVHQVPPTFLELDPDDRFHPKEDVVIDLVATNVGSSILVQGTLKTVIVCECDRCLEKFDYAIDVDDYCQYFDNFDDNIDLTETIREDILLAFPTRPLCDSECNGFCSICGTNLNKGECDCILEIVELDEESEEAASIWSCFDNLDLDNLESCQCSYAT